MNMTESAVLAGSFVSGIISPDLNKCGGCLSLSAEAS